MFDKQLTSTQSSLDAMFGRLAFHVVFYSSVYAPSQKGTLLSGSQYRIQPTSRLFPGQVLIPHFSWDIPSLAKEIDPEQRAPSRQDWQLAPDKATYGAAAWPGGGRGVERME